MSKGWALVTGGARRLGRAISLVLAEAGYDVIVHYHHSAQEAAATAADVRAAGREALVLSADLRQPQALEMLFKQIEDQCTHLAVLVNNAADFPRTPFETVSVQQWDDLMDLNMRAPFFCAQHAARLMQTGGVIVNLSDVGGDIPWPTYLPYSISKAGVLMLTKGLAVVLAPTIRVVGVAPGVVLLPDSWDSEQHPPTKRVPLQRVGNADDIAQTVRFLVESPYITGETVTVDGGRRWG